MPPDSVVIVGVGMMTAVGLSAAETAASVRAGTMRFGESSVHDKEDEPVTLAQVPADAIPPLTRAAATMSGLTGRERRMLRLATRPLLEAIAPLAATGSMGGVPLCMALPETETRLPLGRERFVRALAAQVGGVFDAARTDASHAGRAGGVAAIGQAAITIHSGAAFVIAGGIDTYFDPYVIATLDVEQRVKSHVNVDGFIPGEGGGFLLLASEQAAAARGLTPLARLSPVATGFEPGHLYSSEPYRGDGLAATLAQLVAYGAPTPFAEVYASMNGESHWAKEWGVGHLRNSAAFGPNHGMHHPADRFGDTGAACGPLMTGLAALGIKGSYRRSPTVVYASSDRGGRAAVALAAP
ncbi:MAG: hypothetical protein M3303_16155 [Gemmatimonadota bacterium]|nr:hypothetical protein [Gemmatimonadota bacterium]